MASLYERLGGEAAINAAVDGFYEKVLADERINYFFENVDMDRQRDHQKSFLTYAFGGAASYPGKAMREAHRRLVEDMGLADEHFDAVVENLAETLRDLGVSSDLISEVAGVTDSIRDDVLNK